MRITVIPRDIQPGDVLDLMDDDMDIVPVPVESVEKVRVANRTAYRVHLIEGEPFLLTPGSSIVVDRPNPFQPGDWALHVSNTLDSRPVASVEGDMIRLRIGSIVTDPVPASNYHRIPTKETTDA